MQDTSRAVGSLEKNCTLYAKYEINQRVNSYRFFQQVVLLDASC